MSAKTKLDEIVLEWCEEVRKCDDQIGRYSDHEGEESGPTWYMWQSGYETFKYACSRALADHKQAIHVWEQLQKLNEARRASQEPRGEVAR